MPAAVIFDFDGVIVNSLAVHVMAWSHAFAEVTGNPMTELQRQTITGKSTRAIAAYLSQQGSCQETVIAAAKQRRLNSGAISIPILPGVPEVFAHLKSRGVPFGIASNAPRQFVQDTLLRLSLNVQIALGYEDAERPKPAPDLYLLAAKQLQIPVVHHGSVKVFEDSTHGIAAAVAAGMHAVGVTTMHAKGALESAGAIQTCAHLRDALDRGFFD